MNEWDDRPLYEGSQRDPKNKNCRGQLLIRGRAPWEAIGSPRLGPGG